jgi:hypothetical protein
MILGGIFQYIVKLGFFFNIPRTQMLCHRSLSIDIGYYYA